MATTKRRKTRRYKKNSPRRASAKRARRSMRRNAPRHKRRGRRRSFRRNPDLLKMATGMVLDTGAGLAGLGVGVFVQRNVGVKLVTATDTLLVAAGKQFAVGLGAGFLVRMAGQALGQAELGRIAAATTVLPSAKALVYALSVGGDATKPTPTFLGSPDGGVTNFRRFPAAPVRRQIAGYAGRSEMAGYAGGNRMAAYARNGQ